MMKRSNNTRLACNKALVLRGVHDGSVLEFSSRVEAAKHFGMNYGACICNIIGRASRKGCSTITINGDEFYFTESS